MNTTGSSSTSSSKSIVSVSVGSPCSSYSKGFNWQVYNQYLDYNDNVVYIKMLRNDNNCFRNLSAFTGEKAYRKYQALYGDQNNVFKI